MAKNKSQYDSTLNLPKTLFEMRAGLPKKEPVMLKDWDDNDLYNQLMKHNEGKPQFILHDGPPYANGNIHMGTALNKIIKDIIIREKNMEGYQAPYVPGFDTHGLPIELKALSSVGDKKKDISKLELRQICEKFATEHIDIMSDQFKRLGVIGDFEHPYLTLKPEFEARQIEIFGEMAKKGYIYKGLKPVYWCPDCRTALAEAEIEYGEDDCDSIFVRFHVSQDPNGVLAKYGIPMDKTYFVIWTTTTWTLPANEAICLNGQFEYSFVKIGEEYHIMATDLVKSVMDACHIENYEIVGEPVSGAEFELMRYNHVYLPKEGWVILGDHVTQKGSYVCAGRARFDISHPKQITNEELRKAEDIVNAAVRKNYKTVTRIMTPDEAIKLGAMALFGEKYGETVRVVSMENDDEVFSRELCGGTHVRSTGDIGYFNIVSESAVAAGIRRVEFVTGHAAEKYAQDIEDKLHDISKILKTNTNDLEARINLLLEDKKRLETEILNLKKQFVSHKTADNQDKIETVNGIKFVAKQIDNVQAKELKAFVDEIKEQIKSGVIALFSCNEGKVSAVIGVTDDLTGKYSAVGLIKTVAPFIGANGGGGRPDMAQTGGAETSRINEAIEALRKSI